MPYHAMVVFPLGYDFLFKSTLGHCVLLQSTKNVSMKDSNIEFTDDNNGTNNNGFILSEKKESIYGLRHRQFRFSAFAVCFVGTY